MEEEMEATLDSPDDSTNKSSDHEYMEEVAIM